MASDCDVVCSPDLLRRCGLLVDLCGGRHVAENVEGVVEVRESR